MTRTQIINKFIQENGFTSYLEIGIGDGSNFNGVYLLDKIGVDPTVPMLIKTGMTKEQDSDDFFEWYIKECNEFPEHKIDLIFIDGLHHADQVERDIINSWNCLTPKGVILIHDIKPHNEEMTLVPRQTKQWTGDIFRTWLGFLQKYPKIKTDFIDEEFGIGVIYKSRHKVTSGFISDITFADYIQWLTKG
jgi:predicted O-methyltransferase YrrM